MTIGLPAVRRDNPDIYALEVMNEILGGSGFTSRITRTVRSNEGLAYSAGSGLRFGVYYPGAFRAVFQSKSRTVRLRGAAGARRDPEDPREPVTEEELDTIKQNLIETFPSNFASKAQAMAVFAADEYTGRDPAYWQTYRDRIRAVTAADVQRVAQHAPGAGQDGRSWWSATRRRSTSATARRASAWPSSPPAGTKVLPLRDPLTMKRPDR